MKQFTLVLVSILLSFSLQAVAKDSTVSADAALAQDQHIVLIDSLDGAVAGCLVASGVNFDVIPAENPAAGIQNADCVASCSEQRALCKQWHDPALCDAWWYQCMQSCGGFN